MLRNYVALRPPILAYCFDREIEKIHKSRNPPVGGYVRAFGARPATVRFVWDFSRPAGCCRYARPPSCVATVRGELLRPYLL